MSGRWFDSQRVHRLPSNWRELRRECFSLYGDICHVCHKPGADDVDHLHAGDNHSLANLRPIHNNPCHRRKSAQEGVAARARLRAQAKMPVEDHPGLNR